MTTENFADRLLERCRAARSQVVVGLDPRFDRLPDELSRAAVNDFGETPRAVAEAFLAFNRAVIDAAGDVVAAFKPQAAFYEQYGCEGMRAYARTIAYARGQGHIVIGDVKRNDIASTAAAYAAGHLGGGQGGSGSNDFVADAITVNPYLGADGVEPFLQAAASGGRGVFALVKTSNPSSRDIQDADCEGAPLYERVARLVEQWGGAAPRTQRLQQPGRRRGRHVPGGVGSASGTDAARRAAGAGLRRAGRGRAGRAGRFRRRRAGRGGERVAECHLRLGAQPLAGAVRSGAMV